MKFWVVKIGERFSRYAEQTICNIVARDIKHAFRHPSFRNANAIARYLRKQLPKEKRAIVVLEVVERVRAEYPYVATPSPCRRRAPRT